MNQPDRSVIWGAIAALVVVAVLLAIFAGTIGAIVCALVAVVLAMFFSPLLRR
jgi:membrane protein implicated in regulation of membrane protease activity